MMKTTTLFGIVKSLQKLQQVTNVQHYSHMNSKMIPIWMLMFNLLLVACCYSVKGGFTGNKAALVTDRTELYSSIRYRIQDNQRGSVYKLKVAVKMLEAKTEQEYRIKV